MRWRRCYQPAPLFAFAFFVAAMSPAEAAFLTRTETFDTGLGNFTASNGNTSGGHNFGWSNTANASDPDTPGELGGVFNRAEGLTNAYVADASLGGVLGPDENLVMSGSINLQNINWNGALFVGYFNTTQNDTSVFMGLVIEEPFDSPTEPFRVLLRANGEDGSKFPIMVQDSVLQFDFTWNGAVSGDGSGTLSGTIDGTPLSLTAGYAESTFNAFGVGSGIIEGGPFEHQTNAWYDDLTYSIFSVHLPGDFNDDTEVDIADYIILRDNMQAHLDGPVDFFDGDIDENTKIDQSDFHQFVVEYEIHNGVGSFAATQVPEPSSVVLLLCGLAGTLAVARQRSLLTANGERSLR